MKIENLQIPLEKDNSWKFLETHPRVHETLITQSAGAVEYTDCTSAEV